MRRGISRLLCRAGLVAVGLGGAALLVPSTAGAVLPNPPCGSTVYSSVKLHSNMSCPDSAGLVVGRSGITINLNGFTLSNGDGNYYGVDDTGGFNRVTVTNGSVTGFYNGVYFEGTKNANINNVIADDNDSYGIYVESSTNGAVTNSTADYNYIGIPLYLNHMVTVSNSDASFNSYDGIWDELSLDTIDADTMNDNGVALARGPETEKNLSAPNSKADAPSSDIPGRGIYVDEPLTVSSSGGQLYYTIEHSSATDNADTGFYIDGNSPTTLYQAKVFDNTATFNGDFGFWAYQKVKGYGNGVRGNASGNCHNVSCHSIP